MTVPAFSCVTRPAVLGDLWASSPELAPGQPVQVRIRWPPEGKWARLPACGGGVWAGRRLIEPRFLPSDRRQHARMQSACPPRLNHNPAQMSTPLPSATRTKAAPEGFLRPPRRPLPACATGRAVNAARPIRGGSPRWISGPAIPACAVERPHASWRRPASSSAWRLSPGLPSAACGW